MNHGIDDVDFLLELWLECVSCIGLEVNLLPKGKAVIVDCVE